MGKLKTFFGEEICKLFEQHGFRQVRQRRSHIIINYLLLIDQIDLLSRLFEQNLIPDLVQDEMIDPERHKLFSNGLVNLSAANGVKYRLGSQLQLWKGG